MQKVSNVKYLGHKLSADARNTKNIQDRVKKGISIVGQIMKIIHKTSFGTSTVEIAPLSRESILINGILTNAEIWHNLTQAETEDLDKIDRLPISTPNPSFHLEFGVFPLSVLIKARRLIICITFCEDQANRYKRRLDPGRKTRSSRFRD